MSALMRALQTVAGAGARRAGGVPLREALASRAGMLGVGALGVGGAMMASDAASADAGDDGALAAQRERLAQLQEERQQFSRMLQEAEASGQWTPVQRAVGTNPDGRYGGATADRVAAERNRLDAAIAAEQQQMDRAARDARFRAREPDADTERFREIGPNAGVIGGIAAALLLRGGIAGGGRLLRSMSNKAAERLLHRAANELPQGASVAAREARLDRVSALNEFWRRGGAGSRVPFVEAKTDAGFAAVPSRNVVKAGDLYPPGPKHFRLSDGLTTAGSAADVGVTQSLLVGVESDLRAAEEALALGDDSDANIARIESLRNRKAWLETFRGVGIGVGAGSIMGLKIPYSQSRPDFTLADRERMALSRFLRKRR